MGAVEYSVETLVHLYDGINDQILSLREDIRDAESVGICPDDEEAGLLYNDAMKAMFIRAEKLEGIRNNLEILIDKVIKAELGEE